MIADRNREISARPSSRDLRRDGMVRLCLSSSTINQRETRSSNGTARRAVSALCNHDRSSGQRYQYESTHTFFLRLRDHLFGRHGAWTSEASSKKPSRSGRRREPRLNSFCPGAADESQFCRWNFPLDSVREIPSLFPLGPSLRKQLGEIQRFSRLTLSWHSSCADIGPGFYGVP